MEIKIPRIKIVRPQQYELLAEVIVKDYLRVAFYISFIGWYQIWKWIEPYLELLKGLLK